MITFIFLGMIVVVGLIFAMVWMLGGDNKSASGAAASTESAQKRGEM